MNSFSSSPFILHYICLLACKAKFSRKIEGGILVQIPCVFLFSWRPDLPLGWKVHNPSSNMVWLFWGFVSWWWIGREKVEKQKWQKRVSTDWRLYRLYHCYKSVLAPLSVSSLLFLLSPHLNFDLKIILINCVTVRWCKFIDDFSN